MHLHSDSLTEGEFSQGFTARGKSGPATLHGTRHGLNDCTGWFAGNPDMAGDCFGYDGPIEGHVLGQASLTGHYTLNHRLGAGA